MSAGLRNYVSVHIQCGRLNPYHRLFGSVTSRTHHEQPCNHHNKINLTERCRRASLNLCERIAGQRQPSASSPMRQDIRLGFLLGHGDDIRVFGHNQA